jgi:tetratricopeptide (TPR) repeat protein
MAPEQTGLVPALGIPGPPCDIYGLGAVAFASLTGRPPHEGVSTLDTLVRVAWDEPTWIPNLCPDVPADFAAIIAKCLRTKPAERYGTARELARDLDHFLEGRPVSARPATWFEKGWKWIRRHPAPSIATGLLILLVALGLAGTTYHLWTQKRSLAELSEAKQKVEAALQIAVTSANAERQSRLEAIEELRLAAQVPIALLDTIPEVTAKHWELMDPVRQRLRVQVDRLQTREQETGEVLVRWLIALGMLAQDRFGRHKEAFEDLKLALDVSRRFPDSGKFRDLEAQTLMVRWTLAQRSGQTAEEEEVLSEIGELCDRLQSQPALGISLEKSLYLGGSLHARGHFTPALKVISIALQHQRRLLQEQSDKQVWSGFVTLLLLQAQLQHALGDEAGLASSLAVWSESRETMLGDPAELSELIRKTSLELLPLKMFLADRGGAPQQVAALLEEGLQLLAVGDRQNPGTQQPLIHRLRFLRAVHRLNLRAITRDALQSQIDATITQARAELRNQTPIGAWKTLGEDYARVIAPP